MDYYAGLSCLTFAFVLDFLNFFSTFFWLFAWTFCDLASTIPSLPVYANFHSQIYVNVRLPHPASICEFR